MRAIGKSAYSPVQNATESRWFPQMMMSLEGTVPDTEKMTIDERRMYVRIKRKRYVKASRKVKGQALDEMEAITVLDCKTLIRLMKGSLARKPRSRERGTIYNKATRSSWALLTATSASRVAARRQRPIRGANAQP